MPRSNAVDSRPRSAECPTVLADQNPRSVRGESVPAKTSPPLAPSEYERGQAQDGRWRKKRTDKDHTEELLAWPEHTGDAGDGNYCFSPANVELSVRPGGRALASDETTEIDGDVQRQSDRAIRSNDLLNEAASRSLGRRRTVSIMSGKIAGDDSITRKRLTGHDHSRSCRTHTPIRHPLRR